MYVLIVGAGKVGWNLARELIDKEHEVTVVEASRRRYEVVEEELEHNIQYGDGTELWILERAGIERADLVIAVTGDDEDNILISQVAREKYGVARVRLDDGHLVTLVDQLAGEVPADLAGADDHHVHG